MGEHVLLGGGGIDVKTKRFGSLGPMTIGKVEGLGGAFSPTAHPILRVLVSDIEKSFGPQGLPGVGKTVAGHSGQDVIPVRIDLA